MTQTGTVVKIITENTALVSVKRSTACKGCSASGCFGCDKTIEAKAENRAGAAKGDLVEIESPSGTILKYAVFVFLLPVVLAIAFYFAAYYIIGEGWLTYVIAVVPFAGTFIFNCFLLEKKASVNTEFVITRIMNEVNASSPDAESSDKT